MLKRKCFFEVPVLAWQTIGTYGKINIKHFLVYVVWYWWINRTMNWQKWCFMYFQSFYIRCTKDGEPTFTCQCNGNCDIAKQGRIRCQYCRYQRCLMAGMCRKGMFALGWFHFQMLQSCYVFLYSVWICALMLLIIWC